MRGYIMSMMVVVPEVSPAGVNAMQRRSGVKWYLRGRLMQLLIACMAVVMSACVEETTSFKDRQNQNNPDAESDKGSTLSKGVWTASVTLATESYDTSTNPPAPEQQLDIASNGTVILSWMTDSSIKAMRSTLASGYSDWQTPSPGVYSPSGMSNVEMTAFTADKSSGDGYMLWADGSNLKVSEFMTSMSTTPHFMGTATLADGHAPRVLVDSAGSAYLISQSHMMNGFGLSVSKRTGFSLWSESVQLHRMGLDAVNAINMPHDSLTTFIDGQHNVRAVWIEAQAADSRLMTAVYNTIDDTWGAAEAILDSAGDTYGISIGDIRTLSVSGEHGNDSVHLVVYLDSGSDQAIYTIDYDGTVWDHPMRRDVDDMGMADIISGPAYAVYHNAHIVVWVESRMADVHINALRFDSAAGWGGVEESPLSP